MVCLFLLHLILIIRSTYKYDVYLKTIKVQQDMKDECAFISSMMCKKGFLQLDPADVKEIVSGNHFFICIKGQGDYHKRIQDILHKMPLVLYKRALIHVEYHPTREPLFSEINLLTERFPPFNCSIGFSELSKSYKHDVVFVRILLSI